VDDPQVIRAMDEFEKLGIEEAIPSACSRVSRPFGHSLCLISAWAKRGFRSMIHVWSSAPTGSCRNRFVTRETGRLRILKGNRADGTRVQQ